MEEGHRSRVHLVKRLGKYFIQTTPQKDAQKYNKEHCSILYDVKTDKDVLDFFQKARMSLHKPTWSGIKFFYVPELNGNESGVISVTHHSLHDAITQFQSYHMLSDKGTEYPFVKKAQPNFLQWCVIYLTAPLTWIGGIKHYTGKKSDKNCIKPYGRYMSGKINSALSPEVSLKKTKAISKKMNMTLNDLMLGITSKVLKEYFDLQGDTSSELSITLPFTFKVIPQDRKDYTYGNNFVSLTIYLKLIENLDKACEHAKKLMNDLKKSSHPGAFYTLL